MGTLSSGAGDELKMQCREVPAFGDPLSWGHMSRDITAYSAVRTNDKETREAGGIQEQQHRASSSMEQGAWRQGNLTATDA